MQAAAAPVSLLQRVQQAYATLHVPEFRACQLCVHATPDGGHCQRDSRRPVPVAVARSGHGACGPNAEHMHVPAWGLSR